MKQVKATKLNKGHWEFMGWEIEKMDDHWNMKKVGTDFWTDAAETLSEAKAMIEQWEK